MRLVRMGVRAARWNQPPRRRVGEVHAVRRETRRLGRVHPAPIRFAEVSEGRESIDPAQAPAPPQTASPAPEAAPGPTAAGQVSARATDAFTAWDGGTRGRGILQLQRTVGNAAVSRMLATRPRSIARVEDMTLGAKEMERAAADEAGEPERLKKAIDTCDPGDIKAVTNFGAASLTDRMRFILALLDQGWVGPSDESALERIWSSFGDGLAKIAGDNPNLWEVCLDRGMDPSGIPALDKVRKSFEADVKALATSYMDQNLGFVEQEMIALGLTEPKGGTSPTRQTEVELHRQKTQDLAREAERAFQAQDELRKVHVGYNMINDPRAGGLRTPVNFDPEKRPTFQEASGFQDSKKAPKTWEETKAQWDETQKVLAAVGAQSPTVFAAVAQGRGEVQALAKPGPNGDSTQAAAVAQRVLTTTKGNIEATKPKLQSGKLDWRDLKPIHDQLFNGGAKGASGLDWSGGFAKSVGKDVIGDHETTEFWITLGLGSLSAALFIVASFATGGLAAAALLGAGVGVGAGQAAASWDKWDDLSTAAKGAASEGTKLVSQEQADAAFLSAILDTVFVFLDAAQAVKALKGVMAAEKIVEAAAERSAVSALGDLGKGAAAAQKIERAVAEAGVQETLDRTGKTAGELIREMQAAVKESPELAEQMKSTIARLQEAERLGLKPRAAGQAVAEGAEAAQKAAGEAKLLSQGSEAEMAWAKDRPLGELLAGVGEAVGAKTISPGFADKIAIEAIERMGPTAALKRAGGWKALSKALGDSSQAGQRLMAWRSAVFDDLERFVKDELKGQVQRTGTQTKFSNDIDMSFIGHNAAEVKDGAARYLAAKLGADPKEFDLIMMAGLFTDPRRMHAYDVLPAAIREKIASKAAAQEESLIWNRRLFEATHSGDETLATSIRDEMKRLNIGEFAYKPLSEGDVRRLAQRVDALHGELDAAIKAGDQTAMERLSSQIGEAQALINASEGGGYFSGGGVRRWVSERPNEKGFPRLPGGEAAGELSAEALTAFIDQLPKLDHSLLETAAHGSIERVADGIRGVGKYGGRLAELSGEAAGKGGAWEALAKRCAELKKLADEGGAAAKIAAGQGEEVIGQARALFSDLIAQSSGHLDRLRAAANLPEVAGVMAAKQRMTQLHVTLLRAQDAVLGHLNSIARALRTGSRLLDGEVPEAAPAPPAPQAGGPAEPPQ
jgi:hypothetical protein